MGGLPSKIAMKPKHLPAPRENLHPAAQILEDVVVPSKTPRRAKTVPMSITEKQALKQAMLESLTVARQRFKDQPGRWHSIRLMMLTKVNHERALLGKPIVMLETLERRERLAVGHSDYSEKFALYCAELVLED